MTSTFIYERAAIGSAQPTGKPLLLVVGSSDQAWREYMLRSLTIRCDLHLFSAALPGWELPYITGYDIVDTLDPAAMIEIIRRSRLPVAGVITYWETRVEAVAAIADALGLPASPLSAVRACRDKHEGRRQLEAAGVPQARSMLVGSLGAAREAASRVGYPVVVKPRALSSSVGVALVRTAAELECAYRQASTAGFAGLPGYAEPVLVEEYLVGTEFSIDSMCHDGRVVPLFLAHKRLGYSPAFEETGHIVRADDPLLADPAVTSILQSAHTALGLTEAMTHAEIRLTAAGLRVIEVNARTGGGLIPYIGQLATGIDLGAVAADLAIGASPDLRRTRNHVAGVRFVYPDQDLTVGSITIDRGRLPTEITEVRVLAAPGQQVRLPPRQTVHCRCAAIIAEARSETQCSAALDQAVAAVTITGTPLSRPERQPEPASGNRA